jgi:cobalamin synthase
VIGGTSVDWTQVLVALIAGAPAILAAIFAFRVHRDVKTPSGDTLGAVAERTHDMTSANLALTQKVDKQTNGSAK